MRPSLRFLGVAVVGWIGLRATAFGMLPAGELFRIDRSDARAPAVIPTQFPPIQPVALAPAETTQPYANIPFAPYGQFAAYPQQPVRPVTVPVYYSAPVSVPVVPATQHYGLPLPSRRSLYPSAFSAEDTPMSRLATVSIPANSSAAADAMMAPQTLKPKFDRLQLSSWALLRSQQVGVAGSRSLASGGQLGASQAGARLVYNFDRRLALAARMSSEVGRRGGEVAAGVRIRPLMTIPVWLTAERRQRVGKFGGGRSDFALFAEAGLYGLSLPWRFKLDSYIQGGVVGVKSRDLFVDGGLAFTRPVYRNLSLGFGLWGGAQPGLSRLDAGPRVTMQVRPNVKVHADWRQKLVGNARPGSGPALTLAGDF